MNQIKENTVVIGEENISQIFNVKISEKSNSLATLVTRNLYPSSILGKITLLLRLHENMILSASGKDEYELDVINGNNSYTYKGSWLVYYREDPNPLKRKYFNKYDETLRNSGL